MLIHLLDEHSLIHPMNPFSRYIPEFTASGKENVTIHYILSHRGGIPVSPRSIDQEIIFNPVLQKKARALEGNCQ
ncbi:MAG: hypothetical protein E3K36_03620 [Candidatus Brocadia sp.]|nr:hypothetical protein [Candidatus Brocadia sp.]